MNLETALALDDGCGRTAALVAWVQGLFTGPPPVLVGGAAVELYTQGAYTTGDLDLVGMVDRRVGQMLEQAGFIRHGRHWIHEAGQIFLEFPGEALDPSEEAAWLEVAGERIRIVSIEDLVTERLGCWEYWRSSVDGVNALLLWRCCGEGIDHERLEYRIRQAGWTRALTALKAFAATHGEREPTATEVGQWARTGP